MKTTFIKWVAERLDGQMNHSRRICRARCGWTMA